ncbi:fimbrial protein [Escherichia coli]|uniref:fimbrial protein n=1 Tax=Escherichia coli TaxID=562 RepID=UPI000BEA6906|nr:fimbrial protein [Escherichia coli]
MINKFMLFLLFVIVSVITELIPVSAMEIPIKISGTIYIPPCIIEDDASVHVSFGTLDASNINGNNYSKSKSLNVKCTYTTGKPYIHVLGDNVHYKNQNNVLKTTGSNSTALGIALYQGESVDISYPLNLGAGDQGKYGYEIKKGFSGSGNSFIFTFTAVPINYSTQELIAGSFNATMVITITYK